MTTPRNNSEAQLNLRVIVGAVTRAVWIDGSRLALEVNGKHFSEVVRGWNETTWSFGSISRRERVRHDQVNEVQPLNATWA